MRQLVCWNSEISITIPGIPFPPPLLLHSISQLLIFWVNSPTRKIGQKKQTHLKRQHCVMKCMQPRMQNKLLKQSVRFLPYVLSYVDECSEEIVHKRFSYEKCVPDCFDKVFSPRVRVSQNMQDINNFPLEYSCKTRCKAVWHIIQQGFVCLDIFCSGN